MPPSLLYRPRLFGQVPLAVMDLMKQYKGLSSHYPVLNELNRNVFAVIFLCVRVVYWPYICYMFWADSITLMQKPSAERVPLFVIWSFCLSNILLTGLQFFWGSLILRGIAKVLQGKPADDDKED